MTTLKLPGSTVSSNWLSINLGDPRLIVLDASFHSVAASNLNSDDNNTLQIPGTRLFDFDKKICDQKSALPHMMPSPELFTQEVKLLGINQDSIIVVYDRTGIYSSPRVWWMFKAMGHDNIAVLDGGMPAWVLSGASCQPIGSQQPISLGNFLAKPCPELLCNSEQVMKALFDAEYAIFDARSKKKIFWH